MTGRVVLVGAGPGDPELITVKGAKALAGADVVEVLPTAIGSADITALVAERLVRELLTGLALRRSRARTASA